MRFEHSDTVSREHLKIDLRDFKLIIEDLESTTGTIVQFDKPKLPSKEQIAGYESSPEKKRTIAEFREYIKKHHKEIEKAVKEGRNLADIFNHNFYNANSDNPKYQADDPSVQRLINEYSLQIDAIKKYLSSENQESKNLRVWENQYWLYCNTNGGYRVNQAASYGRFYFNLKPEYVGQIFSQTAEAFRDAGLQAQMKIPLKGCLKALNRLDKMVIYFAAEQEEKLLQIVENLYQTHQYAFDDTGIPRFTAEVRDQQGRKMTGVGFGEEPLFTEFRDKSFGNIRSRILADVYMDSKNSHWSITKSNADFELAFYKACLKYLVDPQNPAFNLRKGRENFLELRRRMKLNT